MINTCKNQFILFLRRKLFLINLRFLRKVEILKFQSKILKSSHFKNGKLSWGTSVSFLGLKSKNCYFQIIKLLLGFKKVFDTLLTGRYWIKLVWIVLLSSKSNEWNLKSIRQTCIETIVYLGVCWNLFCFFFMLMIHWDGLNIAIYYFHWQRHAFFGYSVWKMVNLSSTFNS